MIGPGGAVGEYGDNWNFFINLAMIEVRAAVFRCVRCVWASLALHSSCLDIVHTSTYESWTRATPASTPHQ